jgi:hypothetical protein
MDLFPLVNCGGRAFARPPYRPQTTYSPEQRFVFIALTAG